MMLAAVFQSLAPPWSAGTSGAGIACPAEYKCSEPTSAPDLEGNTRHVTMLAEVVDAVVGIDTQPTWIKS